ncbi:MAG: hypothetical protein IKL10_11360 [Clostridia bacterium]|nr:hypothetical protein [Clostridia bacterium]
MSSKTNSEKTSKNINVHADHRKRVRQQFRDVGLSAFHDHNVLEMLLFYAIPRRDTNEFAHYLINEFGSFAGVFDAPIEALMKVEGIGLEAATLIKFIPELFQYYEASKHTEKETILDSKTAIKYLSSYYKTATVEKFVVMYLDGRGGLIKCTETSQGSDVMVQTDFNVILKTAVLLDAKGIIISHNHPAGFAVPSREDKELTERLSVLCSSLGIVLCEHIIFSGSDTCLLSEMKGIKPGTCAF